MCTTNYPKRIPVGDEINLNKLTPYAVLPPAGTDMVDVIKFYFDKANILINEALKDSSVNSNSNLKPIDVNMNLGKLVKKYGPSLEKGAFSNDSINFMVMRAAESYISNPEFDFNLYLLREFKYCLRDIRPEKLQKYIDDLESLDLYHFEEVNSADTSDLTAKEIIEARIAFLSESEAFLTPQQKLELESLREQLKSYNK